MKFINVKNAEELGLRAADIFEDTIKSKPDPVLGLATGSTPIPMYRELIRRYEAGIINFSKVRTVNLDEYVGLSPLHEQSYRYFMDENFFGHVNIDMANTNIPDGLAEDTEAECTRYDKLLDDFGSIDLQLLGVGFNGHLAFCEPDDCFPANTRVIELAETTLKANSRFFASPDDMPRYAFSMSIRHIMQAKKILLLAGPEKREILERAASGDVTPMIPVSVLRFHRDATIILAEN